jgi:hypothetical protein
MINFFNQQAYKITNKSYIIYCCKKILINNGQSGGSSKDLIMVTECNFSSPVSDGWWIDSGATKHIARTRRGMVESKAVNPKEYRIYMGNDAYTEVQAIGTYNIVLTEVLYAPSMRRNLISVPMLVKKGYDVRFYHQQKLGILTVIIGKQHSGTGNFFTSVKDGVIWPVREGREIFTRP